MPRINVENHQLWINERTSEHLAIAGHCGGRGDCEVQVFRRGEKTFVCGKEEVQKSPPGIFGGECRPSDAWVKKYFLAGSPCLRPRRSDKENKRLRHPHLATPHFSPTQILSPAGGPAWQARSPRFRRHRFTKMYGIWQRFSHGLVFYLLGLATQCLSYRPSEHVLLAFLVSSSGYTFPKTRFPSAGLVSFILVLSGEVRRETYMLLTFVAWMNILTNSSTREGLCRAACLSSSSISDQRHGFPPSALARWASTYRSRS